MGEGQTMPGAGTISWWAARSRHDESMGKYPWLLVNPESGPEVNPLDTGRGRFIPTTSRDTFFAELALWLGASRGSLTTVLPNIGNFISTSGSVPPVGFLV